MNPQLASNAASALINTLMDSKATTGYNNLVYSEADQIAQPTSVQYEIIHKSSGNFASGGTLHWDLVKSGHLSRIIMQLDFTAAGGNIHGPRSIGRLIGIRHHGGGLCSPPCDYFYQIRLEKGWRQ